MPKLVAIKNHISVQQLEQRYRYAREVTEKSHYQVIWLLASGRTSLEVSQVTGYSRNWIYRLVRRYNTQGAEALGDQRKKNLGRESLLQDVDQAQLWQLVQQPAPDGGLWNGRKVADWLSEKMGFQVSRQRGWQYLQQIGFRLKIPRPSHSDSDFSQQQQWKKNSIKS